MKVSVIIPVYNAEKFVKKAVESALQQKETCEVLLIEDGSLDNGLKICKELELSHEKVRLFRHPGGENRGAGATRNLGIKKARYEYIAFLDADDYYLPERFSTAKNILKKNKNIDGVYEAIGIYFYDRQVKENWISRGGEMLTTMESSVKPEALFNRLLSRKKGYITLDGLVVKRKLFELCGYFFEHLKLHQDTAILLQLAAFGNLVPGKLDIPVAIRGVHAGNRSTQNKNALKTRFLLWNTLFAWALRKKLNIRKLVSLYRKDIEASCRLVKLSETLNPNFLARTRLLCQKMAAHPVLFIGAAADFFLYRLSDN
ncbi:MAG: glycosyltransferase [Candidatus Aenigmarchaeota archaeon]|nr:glycosyltransferase [Candidatus Aenigmarchaeota archaeon]